MVKNARLRHSVSIFSLILMLLVTQTSGHNYVWCFGSTGHTVIEQAHSPCCDETVSHHGGTAEHHSGKELSTDHCGSCLDLSPSNHYASNRLRGHLLSFHSLSVVQPIIEPTLYVAYLPLQPQGISTDEAPRIREQIVHHRTIVMLN